MTKSRTRRAMAMRSGIKSNQMSQHLSSAVASGRRTVTPPHPASVLTSRRMASVKNHGTAPELIVRKVLYGLGLRYRTFNRDLPGSPDLANRRARWAVFVHGCFWHRHQACARASVPRQNAAYWQTKFQRNVIRDAQAQASLRHAGWRVFVIWECSAEKSARATGRKIINTRKSKMNA